jgi:RNA polymerase-associated protein LEO1
MDQDQTAIAGSDEDGLTSTQRAERKRMEYDEAEGSDRDVTPDYEEKEQTIAEIKLGNFGRPPEGKVWHARLPNFLSLDSTPFDHATWEPPTKEDNAEDEEGARQKAELPDENVIRWRWGKNEKGEDVSRAG